MNLSKAIKVKINNYKLVRTSTNNNWFKQSIHKIKSTIMPLKRAKTNKAADNGSKNAASQLAELSKSQRFWVAIAYFLLHTIHFQQITGSVWGENFNGNFWEFKFENFAENSKFSIYSVKTFNTFSRIVSGKQNAFIDIAKNNKILVKHLYDTWLYIGNLLILNQIYQTHEIRFPLVKYEKYLSALSGSWKMCKCDSIIYLVNASINHKMDFLLIFHWIF